MVKDGIVLGKRYAVLSKIGAGGMADVYKGRNDHHRIPAGRSIHNQDERIKSRRSGSS